jgi:NAD(P)-dependent dehydrogenase (short-subunit alcohol dehydrogenase family)
VPLSIRRGDLDEKGMAEVRTRIMRESRAKGEKVNETWAKVVKALEIDRNLRAFADAGIRCVYHACDLADRAALARVLDEVRAADGPIDGILHGAGIEQSTRFGEDRETVSATIHPKTMLFN